MPASMRHAVADPFGPEVARAALRRAQRMATASRLTLGVPGSQRYQWREKEVLLWQSQEGADE
jgi:hypothetical protein